MIARCDICAPRGLKKCGCQRRQSPKVLAHLRAVTMKGTRAAALAKRQAAAIRWGKLAEGMTKGEIARAFYRKGYCAASNKSYQAGFTKGYLAGIQAERRQARYEAVMEKAS